MAVRFDAATEEYTRAASLGTVTQFAISCWVKLSVDLNTLSTIWCVDNGFSGDFIRLCTSSDGNTLVVTDDTLGAHTVGSLAVGTWCHVAIAFNGANATAVFRAASDTANTITTWADSASSTSIVNLRIGDGVFDGQYFNGCVAAFKLWTGVALSQADLEAEAWTYMPRRTNGIRAWYPFLRAETTDYSGLGSTLSGGSGTTTEDGPPVSWGPRNTTIVLPASAPVVTGTLDATLPSLTASATGAVKAAGQVVAALPSLTAASTAVATIQAATAATLPALTANLTGAVQAPGLLTAVLPPLSADLVGSAFGGYLDATLPSLTADLAGAATVTGTLSAVLPPLAAALVGVVEIPPNDITVTSPGLRRGWSAGDPGDSWDDDGPLARSWSSRPSERSWTADRANRSWTARQPT